MSALSHPQAPTEGLGGAGACVPYIHLQSRGAPCPPAPQERETCSRKGLEQSRETEMPQQLLGPGWVQAQSRSPAGLCPGQAVPHRRLQPWQRVPGPGRAQAGAGESKSEQKAPGVAGMWDIWQCSRSSATRSWNRMLRTLAPALLPPRPWQCLQVHPQEGHSPPGLILTPRGAACSGHSPTSRPCVGSDL